MEHISWKEKLISDESIEKINYQEYSPNSTDLNVVHGDIRILIQNQDQFILPHKSYLYIECKLEKEDGNAYNKVTDITLVNNALAHLFERISYSINGKEIEGYSNVGIASTMKGLLTYPGNYNEGTQFLWKKDTTSKYDDKNSAMKQRKALITSKNGTLGDLLWDCSSNSFVWIL